MCEIYLKPERGYHMINTNVFDYVNVLDKAADAAWMRNNAISNNISNATTPGYKDRMWLLSRSWQKQ